MYMYMTVSQHARNSPKQSRNISCSTGAIARGRSLSRRFHFHVEAQLQTASGDSYMGSFAAGSSACFWRATWGECWASLAVILIAPWWRANAIVVNEEARHWLWVEQPVLAGVWAPPFRDCTATRAAACCWAPELPDERSHCESAPALTPCSLLFFGLMTLLFSLLDSRSSVFLLRSFLWKHSTDVGSRDN